MLLLKATSPAHAHALALLRFRSTPPEEALHKNFLAFTRVKGLTQFFPSQSPGYNSSGERLVAGVVPLTADQNHVLLIQSTRRKGWVLPKGGWETDESCEEAASREAWEEGGITVQIDYSLSTIQEKRPNKTSKERAIYYFYQATVLQEFEEWPEMQKRERKWFTYSDALVALEARPELKEALERSGINRL